MDFRTTRWSLLVAAGADAPDARAALAELCAIYRPAVIAYLRRTGHGRDQADDLAQSFFVRFLEKRLHAVADPERGRFRVFLRCALENYVSNLKQSERRERRGGNARHEAIEPGDDRELGLADTSAEHAPEAAFERAFALALLARAFERLGAECVAAGKGALFADLREFIAETPDAQDYEALAARLHLRANTIAVAVHRLRKRLRELVRDELAEVAGAPDQIEEELAALREALGGRGV